MTSAVNISEGNTLSQIPCHHCAPVREARESLPRYLFFFNSICAHFFPTQVGGRPAVEFTVPSRLAGLTIGSKVDTNSKNAEKHAIVWHVPTRARSARRPYFQMRSPDSVELFDFCFLSFSFFCFSALTLSLFFLRPFPFQSGVAHQNAGGACVERQLSSRRLPPYYAQRWRVRIPFDSSSPG